MNEKLEFISKAIKMSGLTEQQVFETWLNEGKITISPSSHILVSKDCGKPTANCIPIKLENADKIYSGMIWYADDTVSYDIIEGKPIKAVIERVFIITDFHGKHALQIDLYGDVLAPECVGSYEDCLSYIYKFSNDYIPRRGSYHYEENKEMLCVWEGYKAVRETLKKLGKKPRTGNQWITRPLYGADYRVRVVDFDQEKKVYVEVENGNNHCAIRPILFQSFKS